MNLTDEKIAKIKQWVDEYKTIYEIQNLIVEELGEKITFMDTRFLLDDLDLEIKEVPSKNAKVESAQGTAECENAQDNSDCSCEPCSCEENGEPCSCEGGCSCEQNQDAQTSNVQVEVDKIQRPGAMASGTVIFSDNVKALWIIDTQGRLELAPTNNDPNYRPSDSDIADFQAKLQAIFA